MAARDDETLQAGIARADAPDEDRRTLVTLEQLLELPAADLKTALTHVADVIAQAVGADKVDVFLYDVARDSMVAVASSNQPLSAQQRKHGLDVLPLANGGRVVWVYRTGTTFVTGQLENDPEELRGIKETLRIRSKVGVPLDIDGRRRGMIMIASTRPDRFTPADVRLAENLGRWVGFIAHRAELVEAIARNSVAQGRRAAAEELITVFAHDVRNHIAPIVTRLQFLERLAKRDDRDHAVRELGLALRGLSRLRAMISDILDVARLDRGALEVVPQPLDLAQLVEETAATLSTEEHRILVRRKLEDDLIVAADAARVRQCIENVLSNALKYSPPGAPVSVMISKDATERGDVGRVLVIDEGPGVAPEMVPRIFERFATGTGEGGFGLGLFLAKQIAQLHGGDLTLESVPGKGARFLLSLPLEQGS
jgi:signal transduction histidine kinase